ncbi:ATP-binding protein [Halarcobacter sp.]|uniref:sensor histidine kinase n=1 Tax=Halarcobacter sp. TaxID=2321133 RepID=UPI002AA7BE5C|nr:ATP-binding protein [Halarcobacter sp.]
MIKAKINKTLKHLILLIAIFVMGMVVLVSLHSFFLHLIDDLDKKTENLKAKIEIGEFIINDIYKIRSDFYELATTVTSKKSLEGVNKRLDEKIKFIEKCLNVLDKGGKLERVIKLNIEGHYNSTKLVIYKKIDNTPSLEVIELAPKIQELKKIIKEINLLIIEQIDNSESNDIENFMLQNRTIKRFYKRTPAFFIRITENANRLLFEGNLELEKIEKKLIEQKNQYTNLEFFLIINFILFAILLGTIIAIQINKNTNLLQRQEQFTRGTLDSQESIVIVSDGEKMIDANEALINFFDNYDNFDDFKRNHLCICDFFEEHENLGDEFITDRIYKNMIWYENIIENPNILHKVAISKKDKIHYFSITATMKQLDKDNSIVIVTLNDITEEMRIQKELKKLNENLEEIVDEKTKELQILNENLEQRVEEEVKKNRDKERALIQQSRFAALGEMIANIAHQWRQPLSAILTTVTSIQLQRELKIASEKDIDNCHNSIVKYVKFLNQTIEDFRGFFNQDKKLVKYNIIDVINNATSITSAVYKNHSINIVFESKKDKYEITGYPNELSQALLNILTNAKDILIERTIKEKIVKIKIDENDKNINIEITDSAGGIDDNVLLKIFDPYFTTKHKSQGTGIGLYMSKYIIEKNVKGLLSASNQSFEYENKIYNGACFKIELPKI